MAETAIPLVQRRCVIFDFDGTLADTKPTIVRTATRVLLDWGIDAETIAAHVDELVGPPFPEAYSLVFGVSEKAAQEITRRYRDIYRHLGLDAWPLFAGAKELLQDLRKAGKLVAVASSKQQATVEMSIADNEAEDCFDLVCGKRPGHCETKAGAIRECMTELGCGPAECVMVGDRFHDVEGAREAGIECVGVYYGDTARPGELERSGAVAIAGSIEELRAVLLG